MSLTKLIPKLFYIDIQTGLNFFINGLTFKLLYSDDNLAIIERDQVIISLSQDKRLAEFDRPEIRIVTDDIESFYNEIKSNVPNLLHPNLNSIKQQPWGLKEFALLDATGVCVIIQQG